MNRRDLRRSVLLVEDDPGDVLIAPEAFADDGRQPAAVVGDGVEAMALHARARATTRTRERPGPDPARPQPAAQEDGREVLAEIKADPELRTIPVVVLTTSEAEEDVLRSYEMHANAYVTKPVDFEHFVEIVRQIDDFFVGIVRLPPRLG